MVRVTRRCLAAALTLAVSLATMAADTSTNPLAAERWQHRPLILISPEADAAAYRQARQRVSDRRAAFEDRDMILYTIEGEAVTRAGQSLDAAAAAAVRDHVRAATVTEPTLVLIGKDGGEKMRVPATTPLERVFERIDGMPMRQREMRR